MWFTVSQNLGLGVFEDRSEVPASDQTISEDDDSSSPELYSEDSDGNSNSDSDVSINPTLNTTSKLIKPLPKREGRAHHPGIVVLNNEATGSEVCEEPDCVCASPRIWIMHIIVICLVVQNPVWR